MKKLVSIAFLFIMVSTAIVSCKKEEPVVPVPTKEEELAEKKWLVSSTMITESGQQPKTITINGSATWRYTFKADGTGTTTGTFHNSESFTWTFNADKTKITVVSSKITITYDYVAKTSLNGTTGVLTLQVVDASGNPTGQTITGTITESWVRE